MKKECKVKGIVLAGGTGSRLYPITKGVTKSLLPVYDKPMIYYPISVLMLAGIREILIISTPNDVISFKRLLGDGSRFGVRFEYAVQERADGIAQAFIIGEDFIGDSPCCLILGDNIFHGSNFSQILKKAVERTENNYEEWNRATIFGYYVNDPERYGVAEFTRDSMGDYKCLSIEEKPKNPKTNYAVTGLYFYPKGIADVARKMKKSDRGEYEITDVNNFYLNYPFKVQISDQNDFSSIEYRYKNMLSIEILPRGFAWLDTGTFDSLAEASGYVETIQKRQGYKIACLEEIAYKNGWINDDDLIASAKEMKNNEYGKYLYTVLERENKYTVFNLLQ